MSLPKKPETPDVDGRLPPGRPGGKRGPKAGVKCVTFDRWCRIKAPATVKVECRDGDEKVVKVPVNSSGKARWAELVEIVESLDPARAEAIGPDGATRGVWTWPDPEGETDAAGLANALTPELLAKLRLPGHLMTGAETEPERLLKTFANLLADAYKHTIDGMQNVLRHQSQSFAEERRHMNASVQALDRILQRQAKLGNSTRLRVAVPGEVDGGEEEEETTEEASDDFLKTMLAPLIQRYVRQQVMSDAAPAGEANVNGTGKVGG